MDKPKRTMNSTSPGDDFIFQTEWDKGRNQACDEWEKYIKQTYLTEEEMFKIITQYILPYKDRTGPVTKIAKALYKAQTQKGLK